jgi:membrane protein YdbS with pleckstrin-like domain
MADQRRSRADYEQGLPGHHDPTAHLSPSPARSALTLRLLLAAFGLLFCAGAAWFAFAAGLPAFGWVLVAVAVVALVDLVWVAYRKGRGEPG